MLLATSLQGGEPSGRHTGVLAVTCVLLVATVAGAVPVVGATVDGGASAAVVAHGALTPSTIADAADGTDAGAGTNATATDDDASDESEGTDATATAEPAVDPADATGNESAANDSTGNAAVVDDQTENATAANDSTENATVAGDSTGNAAVGTEQIVVDPDPPVFNPFRITRCTTITRSATWSVASITNTTGDDCIVVAADDVTLVGESGATLTGGGDGNAVEIGAGYDGVTVRNLTVDGWRTGVMASGRSPPSGKRTVVEGLTIGNVGTGVALRGDFDARVTDTVVANAGAGIHVQSDSDGRLSVTNVTIRNATGRAVAIHGLGRLESDGLTVDGAGRSAETGYPGTGLFLAAVATASNGRSELRDTTIRDVDRAVESGIDGGPIAFDGLDVRDAAEVAVVSDPDIEFRGVTVDGVPLPPFSTSGAVVYPSPSVDPAAPPGTTVAGGVINASRRSGTIEVDYRGTVATPFLASVRGARFDPGLGGWLRDGTPSDGFGERFIEFRPGSAPTTYGVFYVRAPIEACTRLDAPGVYRIDRVTTARNGDCLDVAADDVRLVPAGPGAGVFAPGGVSGTGVDVGRNANVTVEGLTVDGFTRGVYIFSGATGTLADLRVRNASGAGLQTRGDVTIDDVTVEDAGVGIDADGADAVTARNVTVRRSSETGADLRSVDRIDVAGLTIDGVADGNRTAGAGLVVGFVDVDSPVATTDVVVRNATRAVFVDARTNGAIELTASGVRELAAFDSQVVPQNVSVVVTFDGPDGPLTVATSGASSAVSIDGALPAAPADRPRLLGYAFVTGVVTDGVAVVEVPLATDVDPADAAAYVRSADGRWLPAGGRVVDGRLRVVVSAAADATETVAVFAAEPTASCPAVGRVRATDPDGDGLCEDVDGDGEFDFLDVIGFLFFDPAGLTTAAERAALDFDRNGRVDFLDVVNLLFRL